MAFVPLGSANVAAISLGLPRALPKALELAVSGTPKPVDLGLIDNRHVFFIAAIFGPYPM
ncbi:MAG: diacylglycerol kinase family protein [Tepidamorphaceae bacterium]